MSTAVLHDIRVVDFSTLLAGPLAAQLLGDLGADVIKVESPRGGDIARTIAGGGVEPDPPLFLAANRNKRSLALDIFHADAVPVMARLLAGADVVIQNLRPSTATRCGLDPGSVRTHRSDIIHCTLSAYGSRGPGRDRPGTDALIQGTTGLMWLSGDEGDPPARSGFAPIDITAGHRAGLAVLAALLYRARTGQGQDVHVSLLDSALALQAPRLQEYLTDGEHPRRAGRSSAFAEPATHFRTRDGWVNVVAINDRFFRTLCEAIGLPLLADDPRFITNAGRLEHRDALLSLLDAHFAQGTTGRWLDALRSRGVPAGPVSRPDAVVTDADVVAGEHLVTVQHPNRGALRLLAPGPELSGTPVRLRFPPPTLGQHSRQILTELGFPVAGLERLEATGVVAAEARPG